VNNGDPVWNNMIAYPDFEVDFLNERSLFWRIEANHPFYNMINHNSPNFDKVSRTNRGSVVNIIDNSVEKSGDGRVRKGLKINNYYHEPVIIRNGLWGSRIFLELGKTYRIGLDYKSHIRLYMGLYEHGSHTPLKNWVLKPTTGNSAIQWSDIFIFSLQDLLHGNFCHSSKSHLKPLHLKIIIPDTGGEFIELSSLLLTSIPLNTGSSVNRDAVSSQYPKIAVGIVTYNRKKHIAALLTQMKTINYPTNRLQVFVVDNASTDGTDLLLQQEFPETKVLKNSENLGGSGGFNRFFKHIVAMKHDAPEFAWLIDDDAVIDKNTLIYLVRAIQNDNSIAVAGSVMMDLENPSTVYEAGGELFKDSFGWKANIIQTDAGNLLHVNEKTWDSGYAGAYSLLFRTDVIRQVGIWRDYFLHVDDCEWCIRIRRISGKRVVIVLDSLIWHVLQGAKKPFTTLRYYETRNFLDYFAGCGEKKALLKVMIQTLLMGIKQLAIKRDDLFSFHVKGIEDFFEGRFGKQPLERSALFFSDIPALFDSYKRDEKNRGDYPEKVFIVKEINNYINDGIDYESNIVDQIRAISPHTTIVEGSVTHNIKNPFLLKIVVMTKMIIAFLMPSDGVVILPFWNESVISNNLAKYTAVFENGQYSLYKTNRIKTARTVIKVLWKSCFNALKIARDKFDHRASHVSFLDE